MSNQGRALAVVCPILVLVACSGATPARWIEPTTHMEFALLPAGDFVAGSPSSEAGHQDDEALHPVRIARHFYMATHEVTREQWARVMSAGTIVAAEEAALPVVNISWQDAREFLDRLNNGQGWRLRLPSEAEWEYACRAGTTTPYSTGQLLPRQRPTTTAISHCRGRRAGEHSGRVMPDIVLARSGSGAPTTCTATCGSGPTMPTTSTESDPRWQLAFSTPRARAVRFGITIDQIGDSLGLRLVRDLAEATPGEARQSA